jgi:pantetheine-phosphate adenylyltransferase
MKVALYPGSFDPPTNGHVDIIRRAADRCERLIVAVGANSAKNPMFSLADRLDMLEELALPSNVEVLSFDGLLVDFAKKHGATTIIRGLRALSDFDNEFQMALANRTLAPAVETVFLVTTAEHMFLSSSIVKEVAQLGGDVSHMVPGPVARRLNAIAPRPVN